MKPLQFLALIVSSEIIVVLPGVSVKLFEDLVAKLSKTARSSEI